MHEIIRRSESHQLEFPHLKEKFNIVSGAGRGRKLLEALQKTRKSVRVVTSSKRFCQGFTNFQDLCEGALQKGIIIQVVTEKTRNLKFPNWVARTLQKKELNFELKTLPTFPPTIINLYDNAELSVAIDPEEDFLQSSHLWTNNKSLVALGRTYFEFMWMQGETPKQFTSTTQAKQL
jgi:hypothetical protein